MKKIKELNKNLIQKIAAGEVIERPTSVLRELLDNAIDAGAQNIEIYLEEGGLKKIVVIDDGSGISREDLEICWKPHTTSKIEREEDLSNIHTLGFRGEALSSIAVCSNLKITSSTENNESWQLEVENGILKSLEKQAPINGTIVEVSNLFYNYPARKRFLKSSSVESKMCLKAFEEKAVAQPQITFKLYLNGNLKQVCFKEDLVSRVSHFYKHLIDYSEFYYIERMYESVLLKIFISPLEFSKKYKRYIRTFVNNRAIDNKFLTQAVIDGHKEVLTSGNFPICIIFLEVDPKNVDYNIHPQKREVKFYSLPFLFQYISNSIKNFFKANIKNLVKTHNMQILIKKEIFSDKDLNKNKENIDIEVQTESFFKQLGNQTSFETKAKYREIKDFESSENPISHVFNSYDEVDNINAQINKNAMNLKRENEEFYNASKVLKDTFNNNFDDEETLSFKYIGTVFENYIIVERADLVYFIDQHALHEKIIFNSLKNSLKSRQKLLSPLEFEIEDNDEVIILERQIEEYKKINIEIEKIGTNKFQINSIPDICYRYEDIIIDFIKNRGSKIIEDLESELYASIACRRAVKAGDTISLNLIKEFIREFFELDIKHCPHGRPIYLTISKNDFERGVKRK